MEQSFAKFQTKRIGFMQVHNLVDAKTHLATLRDWKEQGRVRYLGITHYVSSAFSEVAKLLRAENLDFVQINYSLLEREAEEEIATRARSWSRGYREPPVWRRRSLLSRAGEAATRLGRGIRLSFLGPVSFEMDRRASRGDLRNPGDQ